MSDTDKAGKAAKKKRGIVKILLVGLGVLLLAGGGAGAGLYFAGGIHPASAAGSAADVDQPKLIPKSEEKRVVANAEGDHGGKATPAGTGGDKYASNYYTFDKDFTSNLQDSVHFIQVGLAVSTPYDDRVLDNLKTHEIAVRSAVLMTLSDTGEDQIFTAQGKQTLQKRLVASINQVLKEKEGFGGVGNVYFTNFVVQ